MFNIILLVVGAVVIGVALSYWYQSKDGYSMGGYPTSYQTLGTQYGNPLFSPCLNKRCAGGPYMYTNNPYLQAACNSLSGKDLAQTACGKGFYGKPVHFEYSSLSNGAWSNALCNTSSPGALCAL